MAKHSVDYRKLVETSCPECFFDVVADALETDTVTGGSIPGVVEVAHDTQSPKHDPQCARNDEAKLFVTLLSAHHNQWLNRWRTRLQRAWRALRGYSIDELTILTREDLDNLITALQEAGEIAFGKDR
jgi:hypothetical protein